MPSHILSISQVPKQSDPNRIVDQQPLRRLTKTALGPWSAIGVFVEKMFVISEISRTRHCSATLRSSVWKASPGELAKLHFKLMWFERKSLWEFIIGNNETTLFRLQPCNT